MPIAIPVAPITIPARSIAIHAVSIGILVPTSTTPRTARDNPRHDRSMTRRANNDCSLATTKPHAARVNANRDSVIHRSIRPAVRTRRPVCHLSSASTHAFRRLV